MTDVPPKKMDHTKSDPSLGVSLPRLDGLCEELSDGLSSFIILIDAHHSAWLNPPIPVWKNPQKPWLFPVKPYETTYIWDLSEWVLNLGI